MPDVYPSPTEAEEYAVEGTTGEEKRGMTPRWKHNKLGWLFGVERYYSGMTCVLNLHLGPGYLEVSWNLAEKSDATSLNQSDPSAVSIAPIPMYRSVPTPFSLGDDKTRQRILAHLQSPSQVAKLFYPPTSQQNPSPSNPPAGPIIGWRAWDAGKSGGEWVLLSKVVNFCWTGPTQRNNQAPQGMMPLFPVASDNTPHDTVGFHACRSPDLLYARVLVFTKVTRSHTEYVDGEQRIGGDLIACSVIGTVECHGAIIEKEFGWLSQAQTIQKLYVPVDDPDLIRDLERRYQCEVVVAPGFAEEALV